DYLDAQRLRRRLRREVEGLLAGCDCLVLPTVSGPAPGPDTTGDASFQEPFSLLGLPAISGPSGLSGEGGRPPGPPPVAPAVGGAGRGPGASECSGRSQRPPATTSDRLCRRRSAPDE